MSAQRRTRRIAQPSTPLPPDPAFTQARLDLYAEDERSLEAKFRRYDRDNPDVYREFRAIAERLYAKGWRHYGAGAIYEVMRYERALRGYDPECPDVGLNNNYRSRYARKLVAEDERFAHGFFSFRLLRTA